MAAVRHIGFVLTSSYFFRVLYVTFLALCYIFISIGLVLSDLLGVSRFIVLAGNCLFRANFFRVLGVDRGHISVFHSTSPEWHILARFDVFWAIAHQNPSRGLFCTLVREKKLKSHKKLYFTRLPRSPPWTDFYQIWKKHSPRGQWRIHEFSTGGGAEDEAPREGGVEGGSHPRSRRVLGRGLGPLPRKILNLVRWNVFWCNLARYYKLERHAVAWSKTCFENIYSP